MGDDRGKKEGPIYVTQTPEELGQGPYYADVVAFPEHRKAATRTKIADSLKRSILASTEERQASEPTKIPRSIKGQIKDEPPEGGSVA